VAVFAPANKEVLMRGPAGLVILGVDPHVLTPLRGLGIGGLIARGTKASVLLVPA
jgi:hypothetical protein